MVEPRLCVTVTVTFRDDPKLEELLEQMNPDSINGIESKAIVPEDEYLIESFDGELLLYSQPLSLPY